MTVTETQKANLIPFKKGDKRINRAGRKVSNFKQLRKLAQDIGNEVLSEEEGITRIVALLRVMSSSRNPADRLNFLAYMVGKPKEEIEQSGESKIELIVKYATNDKPPEATPKAD